MLKQITNQKGTAVLLTAGLLASVSAILFISMQGGPLRRAVSVSKQQISRDSLLLKLSSFSRMGSTFRSSLFQKEIVYNDALKKCVMGGLDNTQCVANVDFPVDVFNPMGVKGATGWGQRIAVGGTDNSGIPGKFYDEAGKECQIPADRTADDVCPFEVFATFRAQCPGGVATCAQAQRFQLTFYVKNRDTYTGNKNSGAIQLAAKSETGLWVDINDILPPDSATAISGKVVYGEDGSVIAEGEARPKSLLEALLDDAGIKDEFERKKFIEGLAGLTETEYLRALIKSNISDATKAKSIISLMKEAGVYHYWYTVIVVDSGMTDPGLIRFMADAGIDSAKYVELVQSAGIRSTAIANGVFSSGITDLELMKQINDVAIKISNPTLQRTLAVNQVTDASQAEIYNQLIEQLNTNDGELISLIVKQNITTIEGAKGLLDTLSAKRALEAEERNRVAENPPPPAPTPIQEVPATPDQVQNPTVVEKSPKRDPIDADKIAKCTKSSCGNLVTF